MQTIQQRLKTCFVCTGLGLGTATLINQMANRNAVSRHLMKTDNGNIYQWSQGKVFYRIFGSGATPLVLLHDATCFSSGYDWNELISDLSRDFTIYVPDLLGCGRSDKPNLVYTNYLYAQMISAFLKDVVKAPAHVAANGLSGSFAISAAALYPDGISKLILINPPRLERVGALPDLKARIRYVMMKTPVLGACIYNAANARKSLEYRLTERYAFNPFKLTKRTVDLCHESAHLKNGAGRHFMASLDGGYLNWDIRHMLSDLSIPITIVYGERVKGEKHIAQSYQKLNQGIGIIPVRNAKLLPQLERTAFLSSVFDAAATDKQ